MARRLNHFVYLAFILVIGGCNAEKKDWEKAKLKNTISSYENLIKKYPEGYYSDSARLGIEEIFYDYSITSNTIGIYKLFLKKYPQSAKASIIQSKIEKLYLERHPDFRHTRKIKIIVNQSSIDEIKECGDPVPDIASLISEIAGLEIAEVDDEDYDVILTIDLKGRVHYYSYKNILDGNIDSRKAGGELSGKICLNLPNKYIHEKSFEFQLEPPEKLSGYRDNSPSCRVLYEILYKSPYTNLLLNMMSECYGKNVLIGTFTIRLNNEAHYVQREVSKILGELKDTSIVLPLISLLQDSLFLPDFEMGLIAQSLGEIGDPRSVKPLINALKKEKYYYVKSCAALALGKLKDNRAIEPLITSFADDTTMVKYNLENSLSRNAAYALKELTGKDFTFLESRKWKKWWEENNHLYSDN